MGDDRREHAYRRIGDTTECPACGWAISPNAYHCPKCRVYYCFKCRARVGPHESQFQCADQTCPQYGKLLCSACTVMVPVFQDVTRVVTPESKEYPGCPWGCLAMCLPPPVGIWLWVQHWIEIGAAGVVGTFVLVAVILHQTGATWFTKEQTIPAVTATTNECVAEHRCCIQCRHPVKVLR